MIKIKINSLKNIVSMPKSGEFEFTWKSIFYLILFQIVLTLLPLIFYILIPIYLSFAFFIQDPLLILLLCLFRLIHRQIANESFLFASCSYVGSGPAILLIVLIMAMGFSIENPIISGFNVFQIFNYTIVIQSTLKIKTLYLFAGMLLIDSLIVFFLYQSTKEKGVKTIATILQLISVITFILLIQPVIKINF